MTVGIIAEDESDVAVIRKLTCRMAATKRIGFKHFVGNGCGKLRRKCSAWARSLVERSCSCIVVVHDLDAFTEADLRRELATAVAGAHPRISAVVIPKREIEAWFLFDPNAIKEVFGGREDAKITGNPENLSDPKKYLEELVWKKYRKRYLHTIHNEKLADKISLSKLENAHSFGAHKAFVDRF